MINLLPDTVKEEIAYGRKNRKLLQAIIALIIVIIALGAVTVFGQIYIAKAENNYQKTAEISKARIKDQNLEQTQKKLETLSSNFKTVVQILGKQVLFSGLFEKVGSTIPEGAILTGLTLTNNDTALDLTIAATTREAANQAYINVSDPKNELFDKADLIGISCIQKTGATSGTTSETSSKYPCQANVKVLFKSNSPFLFLNTVKQTEAER